MTFNWDREPIAVSPISAVLPAIHAEKSLQNVLSAVCGVLDNLQREYEVIVVTDIRRDDSTSHQRVRFMTSEGPATYGTSIKDGLKLAKHPLVLTMPADGSHDPADLHRMLPLVDKVDIVCGVRGSRPWLKRQRQSWLAYLAFGLWLQDPACHMRLYRRSIFERIPIQSNGCFADVEILAKANFLGCLMTETEVAWQPPEVEIKQRSFGDAWRVFRKPVFGSNPV